MSAVASAAHPASAPAISPTVALLDWSQLLEDFLDTIGVSFRAFRTEMSGGWMFGYVEALRTAGVRTVLFFVSARVASTERWTHEPTGALLCVLPAPRVYRRLRRRVLNPYAATAEGAVGHLRAGERAMWNALWQVTPYFATPLRALAHELRREHCDVLLCQDYEHPRFDVCVVLGRALGIPVWATFQGGDAPLTPLERLVRPFTLRASTGLVIAAGREAERVAEHYGPVRTERVFNPLDVDAWSEDRSAARRVLGIPEHARVVAWHGRVEMVRKGLDVLLEAWDRCCRERPGVDLRLLLTGSGSDADALAGRIREMRLRGVDWLPEYVRDRQTIRRRLAAADVYALPSRHEGFAVAPLEAMACGLPVVAADVPGMEDVLPAGEMSGGVRVPVGDVAALAAGLGRLVDDPALCRRLGARARAGVRQRFATAAVGAQLRAAFFPA